MKVNDTLDFLADLAGLSDHPEKILLLRDDIIQAIKFDLGDEFSYIPAIDWNNEKIPVPRLPYDKVYFELVSVDKKRYGAIFENYGECGVCGQMLVEATFESWQNEKCLFPACLQFTQDDDQLQIHHDNNHELKTAQEGAIFALYLMVKAIAVMNCSNVKIIESSEKKLINKKREASGELPLFTYKTLHINSDEQEKQKGEKMGTHASPRVHLRRGHIRTMANGKSVWVHPCVVGDKAKGIVHKDYSVH
jgi:hypothetical protein